MLLPFQLSDGILENVVLASKVGSIESPGPNGLVPFILQSLDVLFTLLALTCPLFSLLLERCLELSDCIFHLILLIREDLLLLLQLLSMTLLALTGIKPTPVWVSVRTDGKNRESTYAA